MDQSTDVAVLLGSIADNFFDSNLTSTITSASTANEQTPAWQTWVVGLAMVSACSFASPLGIMVVPCLSKSFYERVMTFLIALGIGALSGSVFFMMIPQALNVSALGDEFGYKSKCVIIVVAIYVFFSVDRLLSYVMEWRRRRSVKKRIHSATLDAILESSRSSMRRNNTDSTVLSDEHAPHSHSHHNASEAEMKEVHDLKEELEVAVVNNNFARTFSTRRSTAIVRAVDKLKFQDDADDHDLHDINLCEIDEKRSKSSRRMSACSSVAIDIAIVEKKVIEPSAIEVASIAYMIIFGSSANNFVDGMSMGAAFSDSLMRGLTLGIAVFSQQFPQELGTLAILVSSGLGIRRTLMFNMIPIVLSFIGFIIGVFLDGIQEGFDRYIFSVSSGMYLYIFLGTLIPEIRESANELIKENLRESLIVTVLQAIGIASGVGFMYGMSELFGDN